MMAPAALLLRGATVLTMDPALGDIADGDVRIEGGRVVAVGRGLPVELGDTVVNARGMLAIPGLIDTHTHMWQGPLKGLGAAMWGMADYHAHIFSLRGRLSAEDMHDAAFATGVEMLDNGITTVLDFCHNVMSPQHAERSIDAHRKTGQRVLFCYGMLGDIPTLATDHSWRMAQVRHLARAMDGGPQALVRLGVGLASLEYAGLDLFEEEVRAARGLGLPMSFHQNVAGQIHALEDAGLLGPDLLPVHCNPALDAELALLAAHGCGISFTPESEVGDGRSVRVMGRAHRAGVTPSLGVDVPSRVALDLFSQMRLSFWLMRNEEAEAERLAGRWPLTRYPGVPFIQPRQVLAYATVNAARAVGLGDELGRIAPGCIADLILLRCGAYSPSLGDPAAHVVLQSTTADVDTVIVGGKLRKQAGRLLDVDRREATAATQRVRARLFSA
ncbi:cytosine/adenosine deaminase-related metal-dependent hydrolase [Pseudacidovorax intermedius]|uniref:Cytosine/adenosine deaminase-related metal-dependent hydrolase n=1 Tax=Pseudacidovorax intermedius TaxID=433924 RepID=A0A370FED2_9BURK|nr:amidohydrolase family protein [Pseudacidovorax intermedius]RDI24386.1 cytosine/adenosine deaminase-related metal-dependent hydrolase [Pseudacidovorax intermedius]